MFYHIWPLSLRNLLPRKILGSEIWHLKFFSLFIPNISASNSLLWNLLDLITLSHKFDKFLFHHNEDSCSSMFVFINGTVYVHNPLVIFPTFFSFRRNCYVTFKFFGFSFCWYFSLAPIMYQRSFSFSVHQVRFVTVPCLRQIPRISEECIFSQSMGAGPTSRLPSRRARIFCRSFFPLPIWSGFKTRETLPSPFSVSYRNVHFIVTDLNF